MTEVIYRKYRPQRFSELIGQEHVRQTLQNEVATDRIAHAYLFTGPRGLGKTTIARLLTKAINCLNRKPGKYEPCNECNSCEQITQGRSLDLLEIDAASHTGVDNVRQNIIENTRFTPHQNKFKVFIIDEVHMLSTSAFNALLKTLEEPPAYAVFILCTTEPRRIPETIISRCQRFDFKKVGLKELVERLKAIAKKEGTKIDQEVLTVMALRSEGCIRDAESLLQQILSLGEKKITMNEASLVLPRSDMALVADFSGYLFQNKIAQGLKLINNLVEEGIDLEQFASDLLEFSRKLLLLKINPKDQGLHSQLDEQTLDRLDNLARGIELKRVAQLLEMLIDKKQELKQTDIPQLPLELLVVEFCEEFDQENNDEEIKKMSAKIPLDATRGRQDTRNNNQSVSWRTNNQILNDDDPSDQWRVPSDKFTSDNIKFETDKDSKSNLNLALIRASWHRILGEVENCNHSISAFLKTGCLLSFRLGVLEIGFLYKFHQERIREAKNKKIVEDCVSKVLGQEVRVETKTVGSHEIELNNDYDEAVKSALETFGGELVEE